MREQNMLPESITSSEIEDGEVEVLKIHTLRNPADMLTKCIPVHKFEAASELLKVIS